MAEKRFFTNHAKSSAALVSLAIHALLIIAAISFVAVKVIQKEDTKFEVKPVNRPKMQLKKLQVPVDIKKKQAPKPKLRKRIVVKPKMNQNVPDIKMPEITGVKGGVGGGTGGGLGGGGVGFTMPEIKLFGIKGKGEKIFLMLDTTNSMLVDEMGGIPAYTIIKAELIRIIEELPSTALFNIAIFGGGQRILFSSMVPATAENAEKAKKWLEPLNSSDNAVKTGKYGLRTLGPGGSDLRGNYLIGAFANPSKKGTGKYNGDTWYNSSMISMMQQADTIFLLTDTWGHHKYAISSVKTTEEWIATTSEGKKWAQRVEEAKKLLAEENKKRRADGRPPRVIHGGRDPLVKAYFPGTPGPPRPQYYNYTPKEFAQAFVLMREQHAPTAAQEKSGLGRRKKRGKDYTFNVVHFVKKGEPPSGSVVNRFKELTNLCNGEYKTIAGLEEIQSYVSAGGAGD